MFKLLMISIVLVPVVFGIQAARRRTARRGLAQLLVFLFLYDVFYVLLLYYVRVRWVGWGASAG
jgi:hypothetical protein